ncbi:MAG TPA: hypothetical protein VLL06_11335 [Nitrospiraceae bacterium]|nr:hypothetical protein [Nitrospiraceae bacterium]
MVAAHRRGQADPSRTAKEGNTWQALQREVLYFLTERGPISGEVFRTGFDEQRRREGRSYERRRNTSSLSVIRLSEYHTLGSEYLTYS